jgi:hypothetical protein
VSFTRPLAWLGDRPKLVLAAGVLCQLFFLYLSIHSHKWHWFPRGGAVLALAGFIVSVRESLVYRPKREPVTVQKARYSPYTGAMGEPLFDPALGATDLSSEEYVQLEKTYNDRLADAIAEDTEVVSKGDEGRPMRDTSEMNETDFVLLRVSSILGIIGTLIWAFGDLAGGLP